MRHAGLHLAIAAAVVGLAALARGDTPPTLWDWAKDPAVLERYRLHIQVQALLHPAPGTRMQDGLYEAARAELENASAATSPDVRLRFDLGEVYETLHHYEEAVKVLVPALTMAPRHTAAARAWLFLSYAYAHLNLPRGERDAEDAFLAATFDDWGTLGVLGNRAEAEMRLGDLDEAVAGYREVIARVERMVAVSPGDYDSLVLARWGLAVALDRSGDPAESEREAATVVQQDPDERLVGASEAEGVFFVPPYDRWYYLGLGRAAQARGARAPRDALVRWRRAVEAWTSYVRQAAPDDRWMALARAHLVRAQAELHSAEARVQVQPAPEPPAKPSLVMP